MKVPSQCVATHALQLGGHCTTGTDPTPGPDQIKERKGGRIRSWGFFMSFFLRGNHPLSFGGVRRWELNGNNHALNSIFSSRKEEMGIDFLAITFGLLTLRTAS